MGVGDLDFDCDRGGGTEGMVTLIFSLQVGGRGGEGRGGEGRGGEGRGGEGRGGEGREIQKEWGRWGDKLGGGKEA